MIKKFLSLFFVLAFILNFVIAGDYNISGKISKDAAKSGILIYKPIFGNYNGDFVSQAEIIKIDSVGNFFYKISIDSGVVLKLIVREVPVFLFAESGGQIFLNISLEMVEFTEVPIITFSGDNAIPTKLFNDFNADPSRKFDDFFKKIDEKNEYVSNKLELFKTILNETIEPFIKLKETGNSSTAFYKNISESIVMVLLSEFLYRRILFNKDISWEVKVFFITSIYREFPTDYKIYSKNLFGSLILNTYASSKQVLENKKFNVNTISDSTLYSKNEKYHVNKNLKQYFFLDKELAEIFWASSLIRLKKLFPDDYDEKDLKAFKFIYHQSNYSNILSEEFSNLYTDSVNAKDSTGIFFIKANTDNFNEILEHKEFKGFNLLIDCWATWCSPCISEFQYNKQVDNFLSQNEIKKIYLSFDTKQFENKVKSYAYKYSLKGYHLTMKKELSEDLIYKIFNGDVTMPIPRYILINKRGEIISANLPRPSTGLLKYAIDKVLDTK